jgi:hypothetical protein
MVGPIMPVAGEQSDALILPLDESMAVVLDFVDPVWTRRNLGGSGREAGLKQAGTA